MKSGKRDRIGAAAVLLDALARPLAQLLEAAVAGDADDRHVERAAANHRLQRGEDLLEREVAGGAEEDQGIGIVRPCGYFFSTWPPNA